MKAGRRVALHVHTQPPRAQHGTVIESRDIDGIASVRVQWDGHPLPADEWIDQALLVVAEVSYDEIRAKRGELIEVTERRYWDALGAVPPVYARGCAAMGEPYTHEQSGPTFFWFACRGDRYLATYGTRAEAEKLFASA